MNKDKTTSGTPTKVEVDELVPFLIDYVEMLINNDSPHTQAFSEMLDALQSQQKRIEELEKIIRDHKDLITYRGACQ